MLTIQRLLELVAPKVVSELKLRDINATYIDKIKRPLGNTTVVDENVPHLITLKVPFNTSTRTLTEHEFSENYASYWAKELAIKLARPYQLTTYKLEIPRGVDEVGWVVVDGIGFRGVTSYVIADDILLTRIDIAAGWND